MDIETQQKQQLLDNEPKSHKSENINKNDIEIEKDENILETTLEKYKEIIDLREKEYDNDVNNEKNYPIKKETKEINRKILETHNKTALYHAVELIKKNKKLSSEQRVASKLATILHDSGKLNSELLKHHQASIERAEKIIDQVIGKKFENIKITPEIKQKIMEAIERHMNHPFLIMLNKGKRFPEPKDDVDKIVFDADMLANIGFKNVGFHLNNDVFLTNDSKKAKEKQISILQESFEHVLDGQLRVKESTVLSKPAKEIINDLIDNINKIFDYLKKNKILDNIQKEFSENDEFNTNTIKAKGGFETIQKRINEETIKAGIKLKIDDNIIKNFLI